MNWEIYRYLEDAYLEEGGWWCFWTLVDSKEEAQVELAKLALELGGRWQIRNKKTGEIL